MKPGDDITSAGVPAADAPRRPWTAPSAWRLATSTAEANPAGSFDASEQFS